MKRRDVILNTICFSEKLSQGIGQIELLDLVKELHLNRLEIRSEFLTGGHKELVEIRKRADELGISLFYSANVDFLQGDRVNPELSTYCEDAKILGAPFLKLNIGDGSKISRKILEEWAITFPSEVELRLENNQDPLAATLSNCQKVMELVGEAGLPLSFVFDTANWAFVGESTVEAAQVLGQATTYLHCKNVRKERGVLKVASFFGGELDLLALLDYFPKVDSLALEYPATLEQLEDDLNRLEEVTIPIFPD